MYAEGTLKSLFDFGVADPYSGYNPPDDYQNALGSLSGRFEGIGAEMGVKNLGDGTATCPGPTLTDTCALVVVAPLADSPAEKAGLKAGDVIVEVDGRQVADTGDLSREINRKGTGDVTITVVRDRKQRTFKVTPERRAVTPLTPTLSFNVVPPVAVVGPRLMRAPRVMAAPRVVAPRTLRAPRVVRRSVL